MPLLLFFFDLLALNREINSSRKFATSTHSSDIFQNILERERQWQSGCMHCFDADIVRTIDFSLRFAIRLFSARAVTLE